MQLETFVAMAMAATAAVALAIALVSRRTHEREASRRIADKDAECARLLAEKDASCARLLAEKEASCSRLLEEREKTLGEAVKALEAQFASLAAKTLKENSADLSSLNRSQMEGVMKPLRDQMARLAELTQRAQVERESLGKTISRDVDAIGRIARDLTGVADALSSNTRVQGRKGEEILAEKLRQAGLEENVSFFLQKGSDTDRPDAQVCDTENRWLIIDSKVSLTAYMEYAEAKDESAKAACLAAHVASVRQKIDQLARKKYPKVFAEEHVERNYLPVTAMFVPYEAPLAAALAADPSLWQFAAQGNVVLVTPLTLIAYLRLVYLAWQHEKEARGQAEIVSAARELLNRMNGFLAAFESVGASIVSLQDVYDKAKGTIVDAPRAHTIAKAARRLIELHVRLEGRKGNRIVRAECLRDVAEDDASPNET